MKCVTDLTENFLILALSFLLINVLWVPVSRVISWGESAIDWQALRGGGGGIKNKERFEVVRSIYYLFDDLVFFSFVSVVVGSFWNNRDRAEEGTEERTDLSPPPPQLCPQLWKKIVVERKSKVSLIFPWGGRFTRKKKEIVWSNNVGL